MMEEEKKETSEETLNDENLGEESEELEEDEELFSDDDDFGDEGDTWGRVRDWFQDNLRVILSVLIVVLIAVGIYNYSHKPEDQTSKTDQIVGQQDIDTNQDQDQDQENQADVKVNDQEKKDQVVVKNDNENKAQEAPTKNQPSKVDQAQPETPAAQPEKTDNGVKIQAARGDGTTHLARKALKEYLNSNPDSGLSKEQKIYVEDYMRKHVAGGRVYVGDSREFSNSVMTDAVSKAKQLSDRQLKNLQRYSARVSNL